MALVPLPRFLFRAPLLPIASVGKPDPRIFRQPLFACALALANPALAAGRRTVERERALANYARRAAFRPTPHGLWAGVATGTLGARTRIDSGTPRARLTVSWARLAALGRALLDDPDWRARARLRIAPSLIADEERASWLAFGAEAEAEARTAELDPALASVLAQARAWRPFGALRAALAEVEEDDPAALDDYLLALVDDGLLVHDLEPPLVGPAPLDWMRARLGGLVPALDDVAARLVALEHALGGSQANRRAHSQVAAQPTLAAAAKLAPATLAEAQALLASLPGAAAAPIHAVLVHQPRGEPTLSRAAVERAAALGPTLFALQEALASPAAERALDGGIDEALEAASEIFGAGAFDLAALARGEYGTPLDLAEARAPAPLPPAGLLGFLVEALKSAEEGELHLSSEDLAAQLAPVAPPPGFELFLTPAREPRGAAPGTDWLLGLHAPAGATWGRFAHALPAAKEALDALASAESAARPDETRLDVAYAPARALGDLTAHPPIRPAALALSSWPEGPALTADDLELGVEPPLPLWLRANDRPVVPSPLARVRSTTAPPGVYRLLAGFSLYRQHAPWALTLGPLANLLRLPRISLDGFVILPASWRLPDALDLPSLRRWRLQLGVPRWIQIGREDELIPIDLDDAAQRAWLARLPPEARPRAWELWPPPERTVDRAGRRLEAVVAVIDVPDEPRARAQAAAIASAGSVPPPCRRGFDPGFCTLKLFGAPDRADRVLVAAAEPVRAARDAGEIDRWFFLRYLDGPGRRDHLRLRFHAKDAAAADRLSARVREALLFARASGDLVSVETADYHRELARYGEDAIDTVEALFEADSELALSLLGGEVEREADLIELVVRGYDALASGLGLSAVERRALARRRRQAHSNELAALGAGQPGDPLAREHRARQARLYAALTSPLAPPFSRFRDRACALSPALSPERRDQILPALLHLQAVRLVGPERLQEARAYYLWERALDGVVSRSR